MSEGSLLQERQVRSATLVELVLRLGGCTPDQMLAILASRRSSSLPIRDALMIQERVGRITRKGLLHVDRVHSSLAVLRASEVWMYRMTEQSRQAAATLGGWRRRVLVALHGAEDGYTDRWVPEPAVFGDALSGYSNERDARARLTAMVKSDLLERTKSRPSRHLDLVTLAPRGEDHVAQQYRSKGRRAPLPTRSPRVDHSIHHLLVVEACAWILRDEGGRFVRLWGDEDLRSQARRGRRMSAGTTEESLPDGRLLYATRAGERRRIDIEIIVSKYTDEQIQAKYEELDGRRTLFFATSPALCERVLDLTGHRPLLLS